MILRDGRHLLGYLRSYDQFANLILHDSLERLYTLDNQMSSVRLGVCVIRGENVALLGEHVSFIHLQNIFFKKIYNTTIGPCIRTNPFISLPRNSFSTSFSF